MGQEVIVTELKITNLPVSEADYETTMKNTVEPFLGNLREDGFFASFDGKEIHYEKYIVENSTANVVIVHGFTESGEKFREMVYNFIQMGFNVFVIDNRGHGKSYRLNSDPETVTVDCFDTYVKDLHLFMSEVVLPSGEGKPLYVYAHSMGGAITVRYLQEHPGVFKKAVLSAPMIRCKCSGLPPFVARLITATFCAFGQDDKRVFTFSGFNPDRTYEDSHDTSKARFDYYNAKRAANRHLQTASASYKWVNESIKVTKKNLDKKLCKAITLPVLLCQPEEDTSVYSSAEDEFIKLVPNGRIAHFKNCKHEIYASVDETVLQYLKTIEEFYKS